MDCAIKAENLSKSFGEVIALRSLSFKVDRGELFGFIGPDGSGKTTLFRLIATLLVPDEGQLEVLGLDTVKDYKELRKSIGYMPGRFSLYQDLTVEENLEFYATVFGTTVKENYSLISDIYSHIEPFRKRPAGKLSGGMKQKLALSCALIHKPDLLILDEPTTGVDAVSRTEFWNMLSKLNEHGITTLVSTPYMDEAGRCDRVALIQQGKILALATPAEIRSGFSGKLFAVKGTEKYSLLRAVRNYRDTVSVWPFGDSVHTKLNPGAKAGNLANYLISEGLQGIEISESEPGIEDRFLDLMNITQNNG
jgi:ABC-type multidrug transport system ATPase subunit